LNNIIEQDHRSIKRIIVPILVFQDFYSVSKTLKGIEALNMIKKEQIKNRNYFDLHEAKYINHLFGIVYNICIFLNIFTFVH
jgi:transposase-like protein